MLGRGAQLEGYGVNRQNAYQTYADQYEAALASWNAEQAARGRAAFHKAGLQERMHARGTPTAAQILQYGAGYSTK